MSHAKLNQLSVMGIRSFDNQQAEAIKFGTPLTLIVGHNGSGKTTIIECLKYLTTGDLPPNSKGGAFIHDPKLCAEKEVLAACKLSFQTTQDKRMICSRRMQLTVKKATRQQKTLEGALVMYGNDRERTAISSRVAELDQMVPMYLGVSKSILDNVIFCHQDESLWPMSEPGTLKKKFDEIFEALKYTKAIDNIKVLRKNYNTQLINLKTEEGHAKEDKSRAEKSEKQQSKLDVEIQGLRDQSHALKDQITNAEDKYIEAQDTAASFNEIVATLNGKRIEAKAREDNLQDLKDNIRMMSNSDEELQSMLDNYEERVAHFNEDLDEKTNEYRELGAQLQQTREKVNQNIQEKGRLEAATATYEDQLQHREELVKQSARAHGIHGYDAELADEQVRAFMDRIAKKAKDQRSALERAQKESREENQKVQNALNSLHIRKDNLKRTMQSAKESIADNDRKSKQLRDRAKAVTVDEGRQAVLQSSVDDIKARHQKAEEAWQSGDWDRQIRDTQAQMQSRDQLIDQLQSEMAQSSRLNEDAARLKLLKKDLHDTELELTTIRGAHRDRLGKVLGAEWDDDNVSGLFSDAQTSSTAELLKAEKTRDGTKRELEIIGSRLKTARDDLKAKKAESDKLRKRVEEQIQTEEEPSRDVSEYDEYLQELEQGFEQISGDVSLNTALKDYYEGCRKVLNDKNLCALCMRPFAKESEKSSIKKKIEEKVKDAIGQIEANGKAEAEEELQSVKAVKPSFDRWVRLRDEELPRAQQEVAKLEPKYEELGSKLGREDDHVQQCQDHKTETESWSDTVRKIVDGTATCKRINEELGKLSQRQSQAGSLRSTDELHAQIQSENEQRRSVDANLAKLRTEREDARNTVNSLQLQIRDEQSQLDKVVQQLKEKASLQEQIDDLKRHTDTQRLSMSSSDKDLTDLSAQIEQTQLQLDDVTDRNAKKESKIQDGMTDLSNTLNKLENADHQIQAYQSSSVPSQLSSCDRTLKSLRSDLARLEKDQGTLTSQINKLKEEESKHAETKRQLKDNLRYRENSRSLQTFRHEIQELETHNAESDREHWRREAEKWQNRRNKLTADNSGVIGEVKSKDQELQAKIQEWETLYKGAAQRYREAHIRVEATKATVEDLGRYGNALDRAIMQYHTLKMNEINEIIDDLWRRTYQGTDVDTVLIRSDSDGTARAGNKSYNYRVCMVKQDAEMDMRGRCSAGQKVLASIIIRLALAECFGTNCGVMALDEPTTNLDRDNIKALASSLNTIIKSRKEVQRNFQLIVITHDEDFLQCMRASDFCDDYWRVSRNERQKSVIEKQNIHNVWS